MLKDAKFSGRDLSINKMQGKYFCLMCKENNILELYLEHSFKPYLEKMKWKVSIANND